MSISPLATGLITGAAEIHDDTVEEAVSSLLSQASRDELVQALLDMTGIAIALSHHADYPIPDLLTVVSS